MSTSSEAKPSAPESATRRGLAGLALAGLALGLSRSKEAVATAPGVAEGQLAAIATSLKSFYDQYKDYVEKWNNYLKTANNTLSAAERTRDIMSDFMNKDKNVLLVQAKQVHEYANTFFRRDREDFLKTRFKLWDTEAQALYRFITETMEDGDIIYRAWVNRTMTSGDEKSKHEKFASSPKGSAFIAAENSMLDAHMSEFQANSLAAQNDKLLDEIASRQGDDASKAQLYAELSAPLANKTLLELLRVNVQIASSLNEIKYILAGVEVPTAAKRGRPTAEDYKTGLNALKEKGRTARHVPARKTTRGT